MTLIPNMQRVKMYAKHRASVLKDEPFPARSSADYEFHRPSYSAFASHNAALESSIPRSNPSLVIGASFGFATLALVMIIVMMLALMFVLLRWRNSRAQLLENSESSTINISDNCDSGCYQHSGSMPLGLQGGGDGEGASDYLTMNNEGSYWRSSLDNHDGTTVPGVYVDGASGDNYVNSMDLLNNNIYQSALWPGQRTNNNHHNDDRSIRPPNADSCGENSEPGGSLNSVWARLRDGVGGATRSIDRRVKREVSKRTNSEKQPLLVKQPSLSENV